MNTAVVVVVALYLSHVVTHARGAPALPQPNKKGIVENFPWYSGTNAHNVMSQLEAYLVR